MIDINEMYTAQLKSVEVRQSGSGFGIGYWTMGWSNKRIYAHELI